MVTKNHIIAKSLYGLLFVVVLPVLLTLWVSATRQWITLPVLDAPFLGWSLSVLGGLMLLSGILGLLFYGHGMPMNPFPPDTYVTRGVYHYVSHPIYAGAVMLAFGVSILTRSTAAFWLVSPVVLLGSVALVLGFERDDLRQRFPGLHPHPLIRFPEYENASPAFWDRLSAWVLVLIPAILAYIVALLPNMVIEPVSTVTAADRMMWLNPDGIWFIWIAVLFFLLAPAVAETKVQIRDYMVSALIAVGLWFLLNVMSPFMTPHGNFAISENSFIGYLLKNTVHPFLAFPAWPVIVAFVAAPIYLKRLTSVIMRVIVWILLLVVTIATMMTGLFSVIDIAGAFAVVLVVVFRRSVWHGIQYLSEKVADSWKEWTFGPVRIINHGFYAATGVFFGVIVLGVLLGTVKLPAVFFVVVMSMIGAAIWAQVIEGSAKLLRPLGFYGGVIGAIIGCLLAPLLFNISAIEIMAAVAVAGPWVQGWGRLRCLVQGCCHGRPTVPEIGIRYFHERSRVTRLSDFKGVYLHPTPVYSILGNIITAVILLRLWFTPVPRTFIIGLYLILSGLERFVEEEYRGEPQTPVIGRLRLYQWVAVITVVVGAIITAIPFSPIETSLYFSWEIIAYALVAGLVGIFLTGVDFPRSNRRFSRLV